MKIILIGGKSGSGKSTVCNKLVEHYGKDKCEILSLDSYYHDFSSMDMEARNKINFDDIASIETELFRRQMVALKKGETIHIPQYDFATHTRTNETRKVEPKEYVFIDTIFDDEIADLCHVRVCVDTDSALALLRRLERDVKERGRTYESVIEQYKATVLPAQLLRGESAKELADVVINNNSQNFTVDILPIIEAIMREEDVMGVIE